MTTPPRPKVPVESVAPHIFAALVEGAQREYSLKMSYREAVRTRLRINQLRAQMRRDGHPQYGVVAKTEIRIIIPEGVKLIQIRKNKIPEDRDAEVFLVLAPRDQFFSQALEKIGIKPHQTDFSDLTKPGEEVPPDLKDLFKDIK